MGPGQSAGKTAEKPPTKHPKQSKQLFASGVSAVLPAVIRLLCLDPLGTFFGCFLAVLSCMYT